MLLSHLAQAPVFKPLFMVYHARVFPINAVFNKQSKFNPPLISQIRLDPINLSNGGRHFWAV